ncbi:MAG TPA: di-heme oxidoredictase family protein, partial [Isosphaeraceae bacterium]
GGDPMRWSRSLGAMGVGSLVVAGAALVGVMGAGPPPGPPPPPPPPPAPGRPFAGLPNAALARWNAGLQQFLKVEDVASGLGPVFTENACVKCHDSAATGGAGTRLVTRIGRVVNGQFDPLIAFGGPAIQDRGIGRFNGVNFVGEVVPPQATIVAHRRTIPLFGLGLVDAVPDSAFVALAEHEHETSPATAGVVSIATDPATGHTRVGRFGWKAQEPTLLAFAGDAYLNELGVTTPFFPNENCPQGHCALLAADPARTEPNEPDNDDIQALADFATFLAPPPPGSLGPGERAGQALFAQVGCANCHTPTLHTGPSTVAALNWVAFAPYSDFLLHDMGPLGDGIVQGSAGPTQMRTAPLWGLRFEPNYLHDGRAPTVQSAILAHDGQARASRNAFAGLTAAQKSQLLAFLNSL